MPRYIDAEALKKDLTRFYDNEVTARALIDEQPTADVKPVKHKTKNRKAVKMLKTVKRLKRYCNKHELCKDCAFYCENSGYSDCCMIRNQNPEEYDLETIKRELLT